MTIENKERVGKCTAFDKSGNYICNNRALYLLPPLGQHVCGDHLHNCEKVRMGKKIRDDSKLRRQAIRKKTKACGVSSKKEVDCLKYYVFSPSALCRLLDSALESFRTRARSMDGTTAKFQILSEVFSNADEVKLQYYKNLCERCKPQLVQTVTAPKATTTSQVLTNGHAPSEARTIDVEKAAFDIAAAIDALV